MLDNVYTIIILGVFILTIGWYVLQSFRRMEPEASPKMVPYLLPFGLDMLWEIIRVLFPHSCLTGSITAAMPTSNLFISSLSRRIPPHFR
jgi:hypothetical protein